MDHGPREAHLGTIPYIAHSTPAPTCFLGIVTRSLSDCVSFFLLHVRGEGLLIQTQYGEIRIDQKRK